MRDRLTASVDRHTQDFVIAWVRRRVPVLRLVPAPLIRPVIAPAAVRLRRSAWRGAIALALPVLIIAAVLFCITL